MLTAVAQANTASAIPVAPDCKLSRGLAGRSPPSSDVLPISNPERTLSTDVTGHTGWLRAALLSKSPFPGWFNRKIRCDGLVHSEYLRFAFSPSFLILELSSAVRQHLLREEKPFWPLLGLGKCKIGCLQRCSLPLCEGWGMFCVCVCILCVGGILWGGA